MTRRPWMHVAMILSVPLLVFGWAQRLGAEPDRSAASTGAPSDPPAAQASSAAASSTPSELVQPLIPSPTPAPAVIEVRLLRSEAEAMAVCEGFMELMGEGSYDGAFRLIRPYFPISEQKFTTLRDETKKQHALAELQFGKPLDFVFVDAKAVKDVVIRFRFIERYEFEAIHWEFVFYRPAHGWLLNRVGFDDEVEPLFQ